MKTIIRASLFLLALASVVPVAHGQGCTMCYTAAAQQSAQGKHALDVGILMLLTPAIGMFCGLFFFVWRSKEKQADRAEVNEEAFESWPNEKF